MEKIIFNAMFKNDMLFGNYIFDEFNRLSSDDDTIMKFEEEEIYEVANLNNNDNDLDKIGNEQLLDEENFIHNINKNSDDSEEDEECDEEYSNDEIEDPEYIKNLADFGDVK